MAEWTRRKLTAETVAPALIRAENKGKAQATPSPVRPQVWKGSGLICYGREFAPNTGYWTTQWFCFFFIPTFPIRSFFVDKDSLAAGGVARRMPLHLRQVLRTYAFVLITAAFIAAGLKSADDLSDAKHEFAALGLVGISVLFPIFFVQILRRNARCGRPIK